MEKKTEEKKEKFTFEDYLEKRYHDQMNYYSSAASKNQKKYNDFQWTLIILSTLTTIMAALPDSLMLFKSIKIEFKYIIVITSGLVTILTAALKTFKYEELWVNYRKTAEKLKPHFYFYHMNIGKYGKAGAKKETVFVETIEEILNQEQAAWLGIKNSANQTGQQMMDELQAKLTTIISEKFNTQVVNPKTGETEPAPVDVAEEAEEPAMPEVSDNPEAEATTTGEDPANASTETVEETASVTVENESSAEPGDTGTETTDETGEISGEGEITDEEVKK